ncbi:MAG: SDR family oxidoreductase [Hyphomonadaceae bacterium]|jgi:NAD(P)-dependent dehydrogenase (short-subunit alcohol dehydrogenase family)|nr:SDR family oxidoreductase [Hyphomonadaceae bacterium]
MSIKTPDPRNSFAPGLFAGRTALVTGGGRGIGAATAIGFAQLGANVIIASRTEAELADTAARIEALGVQCLAVTTNIRDISSVEALRDAALERFGAVDFLINNAGGQFLANPFKISDNGWRSVVDLNLNGTWNVTSRFMRPMMQRGSGAIVNIVHIYIFDRGAPMFVHSGAARAGVVNMTRSLAPYLEQRGVTINALAPGSTVSAAAAANYGKTEDEFRALSGRVRAQEPEDIAASVLFLCSPAARMINGTTLVVDAAATQHRWPDFNTEDLFDEVMGEFAGPVPR